MALPKSFQFKRGDTLSRAGFLPVGKLYAGGTWIAKCEAVGKFSGERHTLTAAISAPVAPETRYMLHLSAPASATKLWRVEKLECDVELIDTAATPEPFKASTLTFVIDVKKDVTE